MTFANLVAMKAGYCRISDDTEGLALGVARQQRDVQRLADVRGWELEMYIDNDVSAYKKTVVRPEFERMLDDLKTGRIDGIVTYNLDRFARQPRDLERAIDLYERDAGLTFATVEGDLNLQTDDGKAMARVMVTFANKASADTGRRTRRMHLAKAEAGEPVGRRAFGWMEDKVTLDPREAQIAREGVRAVVSGMPLRQLAREWGEAGITTSYGKAWTAQSLRNYLRNPRLVGIRTRAGEVMLDSHGRPVRGTWQPLLSEPEWLELQARVGKTGAEATGRRGARKRLLSGLLRCAECLTPMYGTTANEEARFNYQCSVSSHNAISGVRVDELVSAMAYARWMTLSGGDIDLEVTWPRQADLDAAQADLDKVMTMVRERTISMEVGLPEADRLRAEIQKAQRDRTTWLSNQVGPIPSRMEFEEWQRLEMHELRARIEMVLSAVMVSRAKQRGGLPDVRGRLQPVWR